MKTIYLYLTLCLLLCSTSIFGQELAKHAKNKVIEKHNKSLPVFHIIDYTLTDVDNGKEISINENGLYLFADSSLVNGIIYFYLTTSDNINSVYGWRNGKIINGKKKDVGLRKYI